VDTGSVPLHTGEFSQAGPGTIDTDDVDPVAEADVYMAYGRDAQAEEILLEAMQKDPSRLAIHAKLLEIYANRRSLKQFETLAAELYAQTAGIGPEWEKVAALGAGIDPANPLYGAKDAADAPSSAKVFDPDATLVVKPGPLAAAGAVGGLAGAFDTVSPESDTANEALTFTTEVEAPTEKVADYEATMLSSAPLIDVLPEASALGADDEGMSLDFDLGGELDSTAQPTATQPSEVAPFAGLDELPLAAEPEPEQGGLAMEVESSSEALDFDLSGMVGGESDADAANPAEELATALAADAALDELAAMDLPSFDEPEEAATLSGLDEIPGLALPETQAVSEAENLLEMDFDLDAASVMPSADLPEPAAPLAEEGFSLAVDAEAIPAFAPAAPDAQEEAAVAPAADLDLSLDMPEPSRAPLEAMPESVEVMDFDITPEESATLEEALPDSDFDLASINLDLSAEPLEEVSTAGISLEEDFAPLGGEEPAEAEAEALASEAVAPQDDPRWEEVNTKLDLAKAYEEMGDLEGARELLQEVIGDGPADLMAQAQAILDRMGS
jgi:pilus assembly protein FimV